MTFPTAWICPCCRHMFAPTVASCPLCSLTGQFSDELRALHDCAEWGPVADRFLGYLERDVATATVTVPQFRVTPRPHIGPMKVTIITPCVSCDMPQNECERVSGRRRCCAACDHVGIELRKI